jgi:hypothetical protein
MSTHRPGVHEGYLVSHTLKVTDLTEDKSGAVLNDIDSQIGVDTTSVDPDHSEITVSYDASVIDMDTICQHLQQQGVGIDPGWWNQFKLNWDRQIDQNVKDNAAHEPSCCNKPLSGQRRSH